MSKNLLKYNNYYVLYLEFTDKAKKLGILSKLSSYIIDTKSL